MQNKVSKETIILSVLMLIVVWLLVGCTTVKFRYEKSGTVQVSRTAFLTKLNVGEMAISTNGIATVKTVNSVPDSETIKKFMDMMQAFASIFATPR